MGPICDYSASTYFCRAVPYRKNCVVVLGSWAHVDLVLPVFSFVPALSVPLSVGTLGALFQERKMRIFLC